MDSQGFVLGVGVVVNNFIQVPAFKLSSTQKSRHRVYSETSPRQKFQARQDGESVCVCARIIGSQGYRHENQAVQHSTTVVGSPEAPTVATPLPLKLTFGARDQ